MPRRSWALLAGLLTWRLLLAGTAEAQTAAPTPESAAAGPAVLSIGVVKGRTGTQVAIGGDAELAYEYSVIGETNLVVDIPGASSRVWPAEQAVDDEFVSRVRVAELSGERRGVRVVLELKRPEAFTISGGGGRIVVSFAGPAAAEPEAGLNRVTAVSAFPAGGAYRIRIATEAAPAFRVLAQEDPRTVVLAIDRAELEPSVAALTDLAAGAPLSRVEARAAEGTPPGVLVSLTMRRPVPFHAAADGAGVNVDFTAPPAASGGAARSAPPPPPSLVPGPILVPSPPAPPEPPPVATARKRYAGSRITLDFVDADLRDIFRLIADVSGMNIVASDDVQGKRSVKVTDLPWDQALDLILKTNIPQLVRVDEADNVISITTLKRTLEDQAAIDKLRLDQVRQATEERRQRLESETALKKLEAENQAQQLAKVVAERQRSKGWTERTFTISYGDTKEVADRLKKFFSGCEDGCVFEVGERSKTIFVRDFVDNVQRMNAIIDVLEAPTPAVLVEARIVEVQSDFAHELGIQWGGAFAADAAHGNATPFAFPNSIRVGGTAVQGSDGVNPGSYFVNLPATNAVAGAGLTLGHVANTLSLDIKLSALERLGKTKILSNPKVLVVQNEEANINVGSQLPVPRTDAEGNRTIEWKDVGILLQVTPNVTSDGRVFMKLKIEKSAAGETVRTTEGEMFSIERRGAVTKVLVGDGETSVIGGIFQQTSADGEDGVPGLSRLPLLGWLFRARTKTNSRKELMIFLTPRITADPRDQPAGDGGPAPAAAPAVPAAVRGVFGTVTLLSAETLPPGDRVSALVRYVNDTAFTFRASVTVNCRAFDAGGRVIGADLAHIWAGEHGAIGPGFVLQQEVPLMIEGREFAALRCEAVKAE